MSVRLEKIASLIKEEISLIFLHKIQDSELKLITITQVKVSPDIKQAKIYVSIYEREKRERLLQKIENVKGIIRSELGKKIQIRFVPELFFYIDDTLDYVEKMENLFKKIHENDNKKEL